MKVETQFKLQAYLDGELPAVERTEVESLLSQDAEARVLLAELRNTCGALVGHEAEIKLPESREFYWSKIKREINRQPAQKESAGVSLAVRLRRLLVPAGAFAAIAIAALLTLSQLGLGNRAAEAFTDSDDAAVFTYRDYDAGATLVWLDYPAENDFADMDSDDTLELD